MTTPRQKMPFGLRVLSRVRPSPLAAFLGNITGIRRQLFEDEQHRRFSLSPLSNLGRALIYHGAYEPSMVEVLQRYLRPGATFIDLGANEGYFSVIGSGLVGPAGRVYAVEPQARLGPVIAKNLELNGRTNVTHCSVAIGGHSGSAEIFLASEVNSGGSSFFRPARYWMKRQATRALTLLDFLDENKIESCDLMKVDVEGAEYEILMNAGNVLASGRIRAIALEIHNEILGRQGLSGATLHEHVLASGYSLNRDIGPWVYFRP